MLVILQPGVTVVTQTQLLETIRQAGLRAELLQGQDRQIIAVVGAPDETLSRSLGSHAAVAELLLEQAEIAPLTRNLRVVENRPLISPAIVLETLPLPAASAHLVSQSRNAVVDILNQADDRLLVVVGPCSIHDPAAALDYARRLAPLAAELADDLLCVMRVYFEKPRTTIGWKGLINDPFHDESFVVNSGLQIARRLLLDILALGLPAGCEFLDPISPQYFTDAVTWGAIGARTTESQVHRELASGLSMPIGFKNGTGGGLQLAVDAVGAAAYPHQFLGVTEQGLAAIVATSGNLDTHIILRGGRTGTNYDAASVNTALDLLRASNQAPRLMIDTSHGNSNKDYRRQPEVATAVARQIAGGQRGIIGVLLESFLVAGRQDLQPNTPLVYGQSVTDACMDWEMTVPLLQNLAQAVRARRAGDPSLWRATDGLGNND